MLPARVTRWFAPALALVAVALLVPRLNAFGLWDPHEVRVADAAQAMIQSNTWTSAQMGRSPALLWPTGIGFRMLGVNEVGGRLPLVLVALATLLLTYGAALSFLRSARGAAIASLALLTSPSFFLGARQLAIGIPPMFGAALTLAGVASLTHLSGSMARRAIGGLLVALGVTVGALTAGVWVGLAAPLAAVAFAYYLDDRKGLALGFAVPALAAVAAGAWLFASAKGFSLGMGGTPHAFVHGTVATSMMKQLGFALFPWGLLVPFAVGALLSGERSFHATLLVAWAMATYAAATATAAAVVDQLVPIGPIACLLVGAYLDRLLDESEALPFVGFAIAALTLVVGRDFFLNPEQYVGAHMLDAVRWPTVIPAIPNALMAFSVAWAGLVGLAIGVPLSKRDGDVETQRRGRALLTGGAMIVSLGIAFVTTQWIVPTLSKHLSARDLYGKTRQLDPNAPVGQFHFTATGAAYYAGGKQPEQLATLNDVWKFLGREERVFVMAGSDELASLDQGARLSKTTYYVVDDSNSHYLILSNRLGPKETDLNPLKTMVTETPPTPKTPVSIDFEGKLELIGYDFPAEATKGSDWKVKLYFKVKQPLGGSYKVFMHFDGPGNRLNGDHVPMAGRFPTQFWVPGTYVTDEHIMHADRVMQASGRYQVFMGMFLGDKRLKIVSGEQDGDNRAKLGIVNIK